MLQTMLFFHILAVIGLFAGIAIEMIALLRVHRAATLGDVRAALLNVPVVGPLMGVSSLLLIAMGIGMVYAGGFGWNLGWINVVFALTLVLAILGPAITGRRADALHALALKAGEGPITQAVEAARQDRVFNYMVFLSLLELVAALYIMVAKPEALPASIVVAAAALLAIIPPALVTRRTSALAAAAET